METLPSYVSIVLVLTTFVTIFFFYKAASNSLNTIIVLTAWLALQTIISMNEFYTNTQGFPPRFLLVLGPPLVIIILLFTTNKGRQYIDNLDAKWLTLLHVVRIPVELVLLWLFIHKTVPQIMTFEGRNFDILSGITAPIVYYFIFVKKSFSNKVLLIWNIVCLLLLFNIVFTAIFSVPFPFQKFAFDQPNIAVLYFPFVWLPCCIVPLVLFAHLTVIRQILKKGIKTEVV